MIQIVRVRNVDGDARGADLLQEINTVLGFNLQQVLATRVYRLEGLNGEEADLLAKRLLCDPVTQWYQVGPVTNLTDCVEVAYKPGVMNPEVASMMKAASDMGLTQLIAADSSWEYQFVPTLTQQQRGEVINRLLVNETVERVITDEPETLLISDEVGTIGIVPIIHLTDEQLQELSNTRQLHLNLQEMQVIQRHFATEVGREPTDGEVETLAQTWSEHCGHKTFKAWLVVDGVGKRPLIDRIRETAAKYDSLVLSSFVDNSGVIPFYDGQAICGKVETHNSPSAIAPRAGSGTGSGGVYRDIFGTGQGAKTILSTDMFCFAPWDLSDTDLPTGCLHPRHLLREVVAGVRDYGNRMGIPTNNGSVHFHRDFRAKPSVIVGAYGILPADKCQKGVPLPGDLIVAVGGRTGRDGIHGATFSSGEMTERTISVNSSAVQIGNAIEEKRTADALLVCRDKGFVRAITDCGAGGFSSAIGEMGAGTGVIVFLEEAPLKYPGLFPWEIWVSESQERMVLAVAPEHWRELQNICQAHNVEATMLGRFTNNHRLIVTYNGESLCDLSMEFLHNGLPRRVMIASQSERVEHIEKEVPFPQNEREWTTAYCRVMSHGNVCSKEPIVRQYDHGVQGTSALPPFTGVKLDGPNDAVVIRPLLNKPYGMIVSHGLNPVLNSIDPYGGSLWAAVEALANYVAVGGNFREAALIDNFIWPFPDEESLWDLDRATDACCAIMDAFGIPFVSGKDSISSTYRKRDFVLKIPPVLCVSVFGRIPDVTKTVTSDFKRGASSIMLVGEPDVQGMGGSVYWDTHGVLGKTVPSVDLEQLPATFDWLYRQITAGEILSCHDISEGGLAATVAEMCFGGNCGAQIEIPRYQPGRLDHWLFSETAGCFLVEVPLDRVHSITCSAMAARIRYCLPIGVVNAGEDISVIHRQQQLFSVPVSVLKTAWQQPMKEVFH